MKPNIPTVPPLAEPSETEIQNVAYRLWLEGGCQQGVERDNWFAAKELLLHHHGRSSHPDKKHPEPPATAVSSPLAPTSD